MAYAVWSVTAGEVPTSTKWNILGTNDAGFNDGTNIAAGAINNTHIAANNLFTTKISNPYKFSVYRGVSAQVITAGVVQYDTKIYDTGSNVDIVTNKGRFTAPVAGYYHFNSSYLVGATNGDHYVVSFYKNAAELNRYSEINAGGTSNITGNGGVDVLLAAGDYIEVSVGFGASRSMLNGIPYNFFTGHLICST